MGYLRDMYLRVNEAYEKEFRQNRYGRYIYKAPVLIVDTNTKSKLIRLSPNVVRKVGKK